MHVKAILRIYRYLPYIYYYDIYWEKIDRVVVYEPIESKEPSECRCKIKLIGAFSRAASATPVSFEL